jgi:GT2 family glycosyltransferase
MAAREVSALTGAVLLTDRAAFERVGGFDETLALSFQDVDYGLKLHQLGLRNVFEPKSILIHMESVSLDKAGSDRLLLLQRHREKALFMERWRPVFAADPFYPAELDLDDESGLSLRRR